MNKLAAKIGQMLMVGLEGEELTREERNDMKRYGFGGCVLFSRNCRDPAQLVRLCRSVWETATAEPPFIAIDQEGGRVHRLPRPFTHFPAAAVIARTQEPELAYAVARATASELALAGINVNFAPVLDVNSNVISPVVGERAFSADSTEVIRFAASWLEGSREGGIIPCGKHFPGHGDADKDSHLELPIVNTSVEDLKKIALQPFLYGCNNGIESLMTAHVLFRALDPEWPATLSRAIIGKLLREDFGYDGVVYSDDLAMQAISGNYGPDDAALLAVEAGVDVLLYCCEIHSAIRAFERLCARAQRESTLARRVEASHHRVTRLKRRYLKSFTGAGESEVEKRLVALDHQKILERIYGSR